MRRILSSVLGAALLGAAAAPATAITIGSPLTDDSTPFITELNFVQDGDCVDVTLSVSGSSPNVGDIRGLFFNIPNDSLLGNLTIEGADVTTSEQSAGSINQVGGVDNNVQGGSNPLFDVGIEFGTPGIGSDDIQSTSFELCLEDGTPLLVSDLSGVATDYAVRATSVGPAEGPREGSSKVVGDDGDDTTTGDDTTGDDTTGDDTTTTGDDNEDSTDEPGDDGNAIPEPVTFTLGLMAVGGLGLAATRRRA